MSKLKFSKLTKRYVIFLTLICLIFFGVIFAFNKTKPLTQSQIHSSIYLGMWTQGFFDSNTNKLHPEELEKIEKEIGKKVAIAHYFRGWEALSNPSFVDELKTISDHGWRPMVSANPYFFDECKSDGMTLYKAIWLGNCDEFLHKIGRNLKKYEEPFFLRFAWEMNIPSIEWSIQKSGSTPEEYVWAWQRFHDILKEEGVTNAIWVFSPQVDTPDSIDMASLYPGDEYTDWIGLDGYNWGTTQSWSSWQSFSAVFDQSYKKILTIAPEKPLMIAEVNSTSKGGDKGEWYLTMLKDEIPNTYPKIKAIVFFNEDKTHLENVSWLIDDTKSTLSAFREGIDNPIYNSTFLLVSSVSL